MQIPKSVIPVPHQMRDKLQRVYQRLAGSYHCFAGSYHRLAGSYHRLAVIQEAKNKMDPEPAPG